MQRATETDNRDNPWQAAVGRDGQEDRWREERRREWKGREHGGGDREGQQQRLQEHEPELENGHPRARYLKQDLESE